MTLDVQSEEGTQSKQFSFISPIFIFFAFWRPSDMHHLLLLVKIRIKRAALHASDVLQGQQLDNLSILALMNRCNPWEFNRPQTSRITAVLTHRHVVLWRMLKSSPVWSPRKFKASSYFHLLPYLFILLFYFDTRSKEHGKWTFDDSFHGLGWMSNLPSLPFFGTEWCMSIHSGCMEESLSVGSL